MFRSVRFYSVTSPWPESEQALADKLGAAAFKPCGPYSERSSGWEPLGGHGGPLARRVAGADLLRLRSQARVLPAAAVNEALEVRIEEYRARMGEEPGRRHKRKLKAETRDELLPKSLLKSERTLGMYIASEQVLAIAATAEARVERFIDHLRRPLGGVDAKPLAFKRPFADFLSRAFAGDAPGFELGRECRLQDPADAKAVVRWQNVDLGHPTVRKCLKDGLQITHLGVEFGQVLSGVIDANGAIGKLTLAGLDEGPRGGEAPPPEATQESAEAQALARLDAEFVLLSGTLRQLLASLKKALGGLA